MTRILVRAVVVLWVLLSGLIGAAHFLPRADPPLRQLIAPPPDCDIPCWQGIRPDETRYDAAIDLLRKNPHIVELETSQTFYAETLQFTWYIYWKWRDDLGETIPGSLVIRSGIVRVIRIDKAIPFGLLWELLGQPDQGSFVGALAYHGNQATKLPLYHTAIYSRDGITIQTDASCGRFWWQPSMLTFGGVTEAARAYDVTAYRRYSCKGWTI